MPQVTINAAQGLEQTSGSGFTISGVELIRSNESITPSGASYLVTCVADVTDSLDGTYFVIYAQGGDSYGIWIDTDDSGTAEPAGATAADNQLEVTTIATNDDAATVAAAIQGAIDGDAGGAADDFEVVDNGDDTITIYTLTAGAMTDTTEDAGDSGFTVALTDGTDTGAALDADLECSLLSVGSDVVDMDLVATLPNGSTVGQRKMIILAGVANGEVNVSGTFHDATAATLLSLTTNTVDHHGVASLIWGGSAWAVVNKVNITSS